MIRSSAELDAVKSECLNLLIVYYTYLKTCEGFNPSTGTRFDLHRWWVHLRILENDLILRLCRLDDDDKTNHSLREALRSVRNTVPQEEALEINQQLKDYRLLINPLKTKARNYFIAHMNKATVVTQDPKGGLEKPVEAVVNAVDAIAGRSIMYRLKVGSQEPILNLKAELSVGSLP